MVHRTAFRRKPGNVVLSRETLAWEATIMCRNIRPLFNYDPPVTDDEVRTAAAQFVRKVSGFTKPSAANQPAVDRAVDRIAAVTRALLAELVTTATPRSREAELARARQQALRRFGR
jgi:hypothetical protein